MRSLSTFRSILLNAFWVPLQFQDTALIAISVPTALLRLAPADHVRIFATLAALVAFVSMVVPPIAGAISDGLRRRGIPRRVPILVGAALDAGCLIGMSQSHLLGTFTVFLLLATVGANTSLAAYQALIPDIVPQRDWGTVSGIRSVTFLLGTVLGIGVAAGTPPQSTFIGIAAAMAFGVLTLFGVRERAAPDGEEEHARVNDWHDFTVVFAARACLAFGLSLLMTFVLFFFNDVLHVRNAPAGTGFVAFASLVGAIVSGLVLGIVSDRVPRKVVVALCGIPMTIAAAGFAIVPEEHWMLGFAFLFGIGFGGIMSTGWALAIDSVPKLRDVARDLGIWGIAQNFPQVLAPLAGGWLLARYGHSLAGYRALFFAAAGFFALGSVTVLAVGNKPFIPWWAVPERLASAILVGTVVRTANRIRRWGRLRPGRGASLIISNHQIELDLMAPVAFFILSGGRRSPVLMACARMMYEPGWMAVRLPRLWRLLYNVNLGWLLEGMGLMLLENELQSRCIARWAFDAQSRHGVLRLDQIFKDDVVARHGLAGLTTRDLFKAELFKTARETYVRLSDLKMPHKREAFDSMRAGVDRDLQAIETAVRRGATFYITPEGEYSRDGHMLPFRGIWERLEPHARSIFIAAISYDPFAPGRLSQLYRVVELRDRSRAVEELRAARPITTSALLAAFLAQRDAPFTQEEAIAAVIGRLQSLPGGVFVDPELRADPARRVREALAACASLGIVLRSDRLFVLGERRRHPSFPDVDDIVAFQSIFLGETVAAAAANPGPLPMDYRLWATGP